MTLPIRAVAETTELGDGLAAVTTMARSGEETKLTGDTVRSTEATQRHRRPLRSQDTIGRTLQIGAGHGSASVPYARRCRWQRRAERQSERQLQARSLLRGDHCDSTVASRDHANAPRPEQGRRIAKISSHRDVSSGHREWAVRCEASLTKITMTISTGEVGRRDFVEFLGAGRLTNAALTHPLTY